MKSENYTKLCVLFGSVFLTTINTVFIQNAYSAAKKLSVPSCSISNTPSLTTPNPVRNVVVQPIGTKVFQLPNGSAVDLSLDLQSILNTAVTSSSNFAPVVSLENNPCDSHLELRSSVTNFQLDVGDGSVSFGFSPTGSIGAITNITGKVSVQIGTISMDFSIWECISGSCSAVAASTSTHLTAGVNLSMVVDFTMVNTAPSVLYNTPIGAAIRSIMLNGMSQLAQSPRVNQLPWQARVMEVVPSAGTLIFDAGSQFQIYPNQSFEIYAPVDASSTGTCNVFQTVAYVHTIMADTVSSTASVDQVFSTRGVQVGDLVMIRNVSAQ